MPADAYKSPTNGKGATLFDADRAAAGARGELMRRLADAPLRFRFAWRGADFSGEIAREGDSLVVRIVGELAVVPYSIEDPVRRAELLALAECCRAQGLGEVRVINGHRLVLENAIALEPAPDDTVRGLVAHLTQMVLRASPYLDLVADSRGSYLGAA